MTAAQPETMMEVDCALRVPKLRRPRSGLTGTTISTDGQSLSDSREMRSTKDLLAITGIWVDRQWRDV